MALDAHGVEHSSSCSRSDRRHEYDVFLSFRGEDTRKTFTDHLYAALRCNGLITFRDEEELERGEVINPSLLRAIEESFSAIVVLSKNYAFSRWCLDELLKIADYRKELGLHVFPIFYGVDPTDVRHQRGSFEEAFVKHEQKFAHRKVQRWRDALKDIADIAGWNSQDYRCETELIDFVAEKVMRLKLNGELPFDLNDYELVEIDVKIAGFESFLANTSEEVQFIGIWARGGLGKTTLARAVYKRIKKNYEVHFFLHNVREKSAQYSGLIELQKELLSHPKRRARMEVELIEKVAEEVSLKLQDQLSSHLNDGGLVGIDVKIAEFELLLANTSEEVQSIGIWGMGGLGKTTLARTVYKRIKKNYDVHFFLQNVREKSAQGDGLIKLQKILLSHPKRRIGAELGNYYDGRELIKRMLCNTRVLLVLDDVSDSSQLENLAGEKGWFGQGSTIIITTRDQRLLVEYGVSQYKMNFLSQAESRQLFLQKAFKGDQPNEHYLELSNTVIKSAKGLPLAVKVFGSFLCGRSESEWEDALRKVPPNDILEILKVSFDGLEYNEKNIFLDIACFFNGMAKDNVIQILESCGLHAKSGIGILIEKSMVTESDGCLMVHDMLQEMGKKIVFHESPDDAGKRSRIWSLEDANHVLGNKKGTEAIRGMVVRFDKPHVIRLDREAFSSMSNLKLLIISHSSHDHLNLLHGLKCLSNSVKVIQWKGYPLHFLPSQTQFDELVDLKMQHSKLKELWRGDQFLQSLKFIDLSHSKNLIKTPNFNKTPHLQRLILEGCTKLVEVHHSLGQHKCLVIVDFKGCKSIKTLPTKLEMMNCLETFVLSGCSKVKKLPEFGEGMERLSKLDLEGTAISKLPRSLVNLIALAILNLKDCKNLVCLPSDFQKLKAIKNINISGCSMISRLPDNLNENDSLEELDVGETAIKEVPSSLNNLKVLSLRGCRGHQVQQRSSLLKLAFRLQKPSSSTKSLWSPSFSNLSSLGILRLSYCNLHEDSLSSGISNLSSLTVLDLCGNNFVEFPSGLISRLQKLECITLNDCPRLQSLPQIPANLSIIEAVDCPSLKHYVCSQHLWEFIEQFEYQTRCRSEISGQAWKCHRLSDHMSTIITWDSQVSEFMQPTRVLTIPGSEVPPWFHNQKYSCVEDCPYEYTPTNVSFIVNTPDSCRSGEWWGMAVCLVLENDLEFANSRDKVYWTYKVSKSKYSNSFRCCGIHVQSSCRHQRCIIYIRFSSFVVEQLQVVFFTNNRGPQEKSAFKIAQCGWRVLCREDVERWQNIRDEECSSRENDQFIS